MAHKPGDPYFPLPDGFPAGLINVFSRPANLFTGSLGNFYNRHYPRFSMLTPRQMHLTEMASQEHYKMNNSGSGRIEGCVVECGIWQGGSTALLARLFPENKIYAFDSFCGFEEVAASPHAKLPAMDKPWITNRNFTGKERHVPGSNAPILDFGLAKGELLPWGVSEKQVRENLFNYVELIPEEHGIVLIPGFIRDTLPKMIEEMGPIAVLRIDVDAYAATYECLTILWDHVVEGGIVIFDDLGVEEATQAIDDFFKLPGKYRPFIPNREFGCYVIK